MHMNEKVKSVLVCIISLLAILGVIFVMSCYYLQPKVEEITKICE